MPEIAAQMIERLNWDVCLLISMLTETEGTQRPCSQRCVRPQTHATKRKGRNEGDLTLISCVEQRRSNEGKCEGLGVRGDGEERQWDPGDHQSLHLCTYSHRQLGELLHSHPLPMMCKPLLTFVCGAVFITHTVGLCLPLWSLMLGEGLCPAANEYAAPSTDDCGGGGGGGGSAS